MTEIHEFERPHFALLESSLGGRYSIAASDPLYVLEPKDGVSFLDDLRGRLRETPAVDAPDLPFAGGWIGYLGYELYPETIGKVAPREPALIPKATLAFYDRFYLFDHVRNEGRWLQWRPGGRGVDRGPPERPAKRSTGGPPPSGLRVTPLPAGALESNFTRNEYLAAVRKIREYIAAGDCYQVNLSQKFTAPVSHPPAVIYERLRSVSPSPYAAFLNLGGAQILSSSPECFLELAGSKIVTRPIKGTRPRGNDGDEDAALKEELLSSPKDRAELLMITDLERNDLGRVCRTGSVRVRDLRTVETYPQVHHLVSTIEGELEVGRDILDLLKATFPGGSVTGAPKVRAMQVIRELEPHAREVYCGAIGYVSLNGKAQFNVAIRTMVVKEGRAHFWSGGGIVADSDPESEYKETLVKAKGMVGALNA
ncbi:MAG TPA: aminodeoxychorismate synthase component I [bacterium]|nr:aminodeoxychorismate synthase component I [bacterium]